MIGGVKNAPSNSVLFRKKLKNLLQTHTTWVATITFVFLFLDARHSTLFGLLPNETLAATFSLSPADPGRLHGLALLSYPLFHTNWNHWVTSLFFFCLLASALDSRLAGKGLKKELLLMGLYALASGLIALSFLQPWAPAATDADRVLGLSALVLFQLGMLLPLRPTLLVWLMLPALGYTLLIASPGSSLSQWGHGAGLLLGLLIGTMLRFGFPHSTATYAQRPSYPRRSNRLAERRQERTT